MLAIMMESTKWYDCDPSNIILIRGSPNVINHKMLAIMIVGDHSETNLMLADLLGTIYCFVLFFW